MPERPKKNLYLKVRTSTIKQLWIYQKNLNLQKMKQGDN